MESLVKRSYEETDSYADFLDKDAFWGKCGKITRVSLAKSQVKKS